MFGTLYFGETYFNGVKVTTSGDVRPNCGGMLGTATFGEPYFGQEIFCGEIPPVPPVPPVPPTGKSLGGGSGKKRRFQVENEINRLRQLRHEDASRVRFVESQEEEEIAFIVSVWLNLK